MVNLQRILIYYCQLQQSPCSSQASQMHRELMCVVWKGWISEGCRPVTSCAQKGTKMQRRGNSASEDWSLNKSVWLCRETEDIKLLAQRKQNLLVNGKSSMPGNSGIQLKERFISHQIAGKISNSEVWHVLEQRSGNQM